MKIMKMVLALALACVLLDATAAVTCPNGFTADNSTGTCYLVSVEHASYDNAVQNCQDAGATLAVVSSAAVQAVVTRLAAANDPDYLYYIGLRRVGQNFQWIDHSMHNYTNWLQGQPQNGLGMNCVSTYPSGGSSQIGWRTGQCSDVLPYVCTFVPVVTTTAPPGPHQCPRPNYSGPRGLIFSPGFQLQQNYGNGLNCHYLITVSSNMFVRLTVNAFNTESCCDHFSAYDGSSSNANLLATWSGVKSAGTMLESTGNVLYATFRSDSSVTHSGFSIQYTQTTMTLPTTHMTTPPTPHCPATNYTGATGAIQSPNYPNNYANRQHCTYYIGIPAANMAVQLTFDHFHTERNYDFVTIYDGTGAVAPVIARLSGTAGLHNSYTSHHNSMKVTFTSDSSNVNTGFHATWSTVTPPTTPPPPTHFPPTSPSPQCGANYFFDSGSKRCYHYDIRMVTFQTANQLCQNQSAQLLSIHSAQVENFASWYILNATANFDRFYSWIGLQASHGQFSRWTDGSAVDYTSWEAGNPNLSYGQCVVYQAWQVGNKTNGWRTFPCSSHRPFVCAKNRID